MSHAYKTELSSQWVEQAYKGAFIPCKIMHPHSCEKHALMLFKITFINAFKFYTYIHGFPFVIFKLKRMLKSPLYEIKSCLKNIIRSSLFLSFYVSVFWYLFCLFKNLRKKTDVLNVLMASAVCSLSVLFEPQSRRPEIAIFLVPRFLEWLMFMLEKRGYIKTIKNGEVLVFSLVLSIMMYAYQNEKDSIKRSYLSLFSKFFGEN